jgi:hypothetical protein
MLHCHRSYPFLSRQAGENIRGSILRYRYYNHHPSGGRGACSKLDVSCHRKKSNNLVKITKRHGFDKGIVSDLNFAGETTGRQEVQL